MGRIVITKDDAAEIKRLLWEGTPPAELAEAFAVTVTAISYISTGIRHPEIKWPDESEGPMPRYRIIQLRRERLAMKQNQEIAQKRSERQAKPKEWLNLKELIEYFDATYPNEPEEIARHMKDVVMPALDETHKGMTSMANIDKQLVYERRMFELGAGAYERPAPKKKNRRHQKSL